MHPAISKTTSFFQYLKVRHAEKLWYDFIFPFAFSLILLVAMRHLSKPIVVLGQDGLVSSINNLLQILSGFYIASLAAVATFQKPELDEIMKNPPVMDGEELTSREFICFMFGYLAGMSILLYLLGSGLNLLRVNLEVWLPVKISQGWRAFGLFWYLFFVFQVLSITFLSLWFIIERVHKTNPKIVP